MSTLFNNTIFSEGEDSSEIGTDAPSGEQGFEKAPGQTGFFLYSEHPYTIWLKNAGGVWSEHQSFTEATLLTSTLRLLGDLAKRPTFRQPYLIIRFMYILASAPSYMIQIPQMA